MEERERKTRTTIQKRFERERFFFIFLLILFFFPVFSLSLSLWVRCGKTQNWFHYFHFFGWSVEWLGRAGSPPSLSRLCVDADGRFLVSRVTSCRWVHPSFPWCCCCHLRNERNFTGQPLVLPSSSRCVVGCDTEFFFLVVVCKPTDGQHFFPPSCPAGAFFVGCPVFFFLFSQSLAV